MSYDVRVVAPAKINIGLRVLPVREDGYHGIESVFQRIPFYDILYVEQTDCTGFNCIVNCEGIDLPKDNTLVLAHSAFCKIANVAGSVSVCLEKHIPAGAGLGGGSSDAAALVDALERIHNVFLSWQDRMRIASMVGSDVFFFLCPEAMELGCAVVSGRGEKIEPFSVRQDLFFVLVCPEIHSSTKEAYQLVDGCCAPEWLWSGPDFLSLVEEYNKDVRAWTFVNSFEKPLAKCFPQIKCALQDLEDVGALYTQMSGSGSAVFGVFDSCATADNAAFVLRKKWKRCYVFASA